MADRLRYLTEKPGWFAVGSDILDRFDAIRRLRLSEGDTWVKLFNAGPADVEGVVLLNAEGASLFEGGVPLPRAEGRGVVVERIGPGQTRTFTK